MKRVFVWLKGFNGYFRGCGYDEGRWKDWNRIESNDGEERKRYYSRKSDFYKSYAEHGDTCL